MMTQPMTRTFCWDGLNQTVNLGTWWFASIHPRSVFVARRFVWFQEVVLYKKHVFHPPSWWLSKCSPFCLRTENRSRKTHVFEYRDCGVGWGGGGMLTFLVLRTWYIAMLLRSLGSFTTLHVATLLRSLGSFTTLHVATLLRSLGSFTTLHVLCGIWWKSQFPATWVPKVTSWWCMLELGNGDAFTRMLTASW